MDVVEIVGPPVVVVVGPMAVVVVVPAVVDEVGEVIPVVVVVVSCVG